MSNILAAIVSGVFCVAASAAPSQYSVIELGSLGIDTVTYPVAINNRSEVAGYGFVSPGVMRAFRTRPNAPIDPLNDDLGTLGGNFSQASGLNDRGQVVGQSRDGTGRVRPFRTAPGARINPETDDLAPASAMAGYAHAINNHGQVVGRISAAGFTQAYRTGPDAPVQLPADSLGELRAGGTVSASAINILGQVVGSDFNESGYALAFRTAPNARIDARTDAIGSLGATSIVAGDINSRGEVMGTITFEVGRNRAFRTRPNAEIRLEDLLDTLGGRTSSAHGMNESGWVVGTLYEPSAGFPIGFVNDGERTWDLNRLLDSSGAGWVLANPTDTNDRGQIVGHGTYRGNHAAFLLTPVPEPSSMIAVAGATSALVTTRHASRKPRGRNRRA